MTHLGLAVKYRPKTFADVVGQEDQTAVLKKVLEKGWRPPAVMLTGPFGTGKTTLARLLARALLCDTREGEAVEPCGNCDSCKAMDKDNHPAYTEVDAASQGLVADVRGMRDYISYRTTGSKIKILCYDESHMLSAPAQNALLQVLEEGQRGVMFSFCTTEPRKMLPTIRSRCIELPMKLLTAKTITSRVLTVASREGIVIEEKAARVIGTYVRGHVRDALVLLEQLSQMGDQVTEEMTRTYLRLDQFDEIYQLLTTTTKKEALERLEQLLCNYAISDLTENIGQILVNAYKLSVGIEDFTQVDMAWLQQVLDARGSRVLDEAEAVLSIRTDFGTINLGVASLAKILIEEEDDERGSARGIRPGNGTRTVTIPASSMRKPQKETA